MKTRDVCPCESGAAYALCCEPLHDGAPATTAEALMRSRYSAYVLGLREYLLATWHPDTRPVDLTIDDDGALRWLGLAIKRHESHPDGSATVEFVARHRRGGAAAVRLHEISRFVRVDGRWHYVDGAFPEARDSQR